MTKDRLLELCAQKGTKTSSNRSDSSSKNGQNQSKQDKKLNELLEKAEETRGLIDVMIENVAILKQIQGDVMLHTNQDKKKELETRTDTITRLAKRIHGKLKDLGKGNDSVEDVTFKTARDGSTYDRIKILQYATISKMYAETMQDFNVHLLRYHDKCSNILKRQRRLLRKHVKSEELDGMLDSQETSLFVDNLLEETRAAQQQLTDIETRHEELEKLEKSISEVRDIFVEMAFLIERQGEQIDCVEYFASKATDNIHLGRDTILKAREKRRTHRMRKLKICIVIFFVVLFFFFIIMFS